MCFVRATELMQSDWFKDAQAQVVFIGSGSSKIGKQVGEELGVFKKGARLLVDDTVDSVVYKALGAKRGVLRTFTMRRLDNFVGLISFPLQAFKGRLPKIPILESGKHKSDNSSGDPFLQGATLVFDDKVALVFRLIETSPGYPKADPRMLKRSVVNGERFGLVEVDSPPKQWSLWSTGKDLLLLCVLALLFQRHFFSD